MVFLGKTASPVSEILTSTTAAEITETGRDGVFVNQKHPSLKFLNLL